MRAPCAVAEYSGLSQSLGAQLVRLLAQPAGLAVGGLGDLTGLDLSNAASLVSIGVAAFANTDITGTRA